MNNYKNRNTLIAGISQLKIQIIYDSSLFPMDKVIFQFYLVGFCEDIHTTQRRALFLLDVSKIPAIGERTKESLKLMGKAKLKRFELRYPKGYRKVRKNGVLAKAGS